MQHTPLRCSLPTTNTGVRLRVSHLGGDAVDERPERAAEGVRPDAPLEAGIVSAGEDHVLRPRVLAGHPRLQAVGLPALHLRQPRLSERTPPSVRE
jgi:hypothetical protein